jgi:hypothetical protein
MANKEKETFGFKYETWQDFKFEPYIVLRNLQ